MKICNNCLESFEAKGDCPHCGSDDWDEIRDPYRFTGGLDDDVGGPLNFDSERSFLSPDP